MSAAGAIAAAIVAGFFASRAKSAELQAQEIRDLEARLASAKYEVYEPILEMFRRLFRQAGDSAHQHAPKTPPDFVETLSKFNTWIQIYGSDEVVLAFQKLMQASFHNAPAPILMRYYAEFLLAARKDLGDPRTKVGAGDLFASMITDFYSGGFAERFAAPEKKLWEEEGWTPPWPADR